MSEIDETHEDETDMDAIEIEATEIEPEADEFEAGHAPDAVFHPLATIPEVWSTLPADRTILCICRVGGRSAQATARSGWGAGSGRGWPRPRALKLSTMKIAVSCPWLAASWNISKQERSVLS